MSLENDNCSSSDYSSSSENNEEVNWDDVDVAVRNSWKVGDKIPVFSKSHHRLVPGVILDVFKDDEGESLEIRVGKELVIQRQRFSKDLKVTEEARTEKCQEWLDLGVPEDRDSEVNSCKSISVDDDESFADDEEMVVIVERAGTISVNGRYFEDGLFGNASKFRLPETDLQISRKYKKTWVIHDKEKDYYYVQTAKKLPPHYGWLTIKGIFPAPGLRYHFEKENVECDESSCMKEQDNLPFELMDLEVTELPLKITFTKKDGSVSVTDISKCSPGSRAGFKIGDVLVSIDGSPISCESDIRKEINLPKLPYNATIKRSRIVMPVLVCNRGGEVETNGKYTIAGESRGFFRFEKQDDPSCSICIVQNVNCESLWCIKRSERFLYVTGFEDDEWGTPPSQGWIPEQGRYPAPGLNIHWIRIDRPPKPLVQKVTTGDSSVTIKFECEGPLTPHCAKKMNCWFQVKEHNGICTVKEYDVNKRSITINGLCNGKSYVFFVIACNQMVSTKSDPSQKVTPFAKPPIPKVDDIKSGDGCVQVMISPSTLVAVKDNNVKAELTVSLKSNRGFRITQAVKSAKVFFNELRNGEEYCVIVESSNSTSSFTSEPFWIKPAKPPKAPKIVAAKAGNRMLVVEYECENYNDFQVQASFEIETLPPTEIFRTSLLKASLSNCVNGQHYQIIVKAVNGTAKVESALSIPLIPFGPPPAPRLTQATPLDGAVQIEWLCKDSAVPSESVTHIEYNESLSISAKRDWKNIGKKCPAVIGKLHNGKEYTLYVRAVNRRGHSKASNSISCTPLASPPKPQKVEAVPGNSAADIFWICADITQQKFNGWFIVQSSQSDKKYECTRQRCRITGLDNGIPTYFTVTAKNLVGEAKSEPSSSIVCKSATRKSVFLKQSTDLRSNKKAERIAYHKKLQAEEHKRKMAEKKNQWAESRRVKRRNSITARQQAKENEIAHFQKIQLAQERRRRRLEEKKQLKKVKEEEKRKRVEMRRAERENKFKLSRKIQQDSYAYYNNSDTSGQWSFCSRSSDAGSERCLNDSWNNPFIGDLL